MGPLDIQLNFLAAPSSRTRGPVTRRACAIGVVAAACLLSGTVTSSSALGHMRPPRTSQSAPKSGGTVGSGGAGALGRNKRATRHSTRRARRQTRPPRHSRSACQHKRHCHKGKSPVPGGGAGPESGGGPTSGPPGTPTFPGREGGGEGLPGPQSPAEPLRLFSISSVFNDLLGASPPLAGGSPAIVAAFRHQVATHQGHVVINTTEWSTPVYTVAADAPTVALIGQSSICPRPGGVFAGFRAQIEAVPLPSSALPAAGTDKEVIVWQPSTGHLWELWRVIKEAGHWTACWGGEIENATASNGVFPAPFGAGASGLSLLGGQIHIEDLEHGAINHALEVLLPDTKAGEFVWPADRTDGTSNASDAIPEGTRLRLSPSLDLSTLHLSAPALTIATAIQRYGMIVGDTAGDVALSAQDPTPLLNEGRANPYDRLLPAPFDTLDALPWHKLEVVSPSFHG
jgi:hypothetical protein